MRATIDLGWVNHILCTHNSQSFNPPLTISLNSKEISSLVCKVRPGFFSIILLIFVCWAKIINFHLAVFILFWKIFALVFHAENQKCLDKNDHKISELLRSDLCKLDIHSNDFEELFFQLLLIIKMWSHGIKEVAFLSWFSPYTVLHYFYLHKYFSN